MLGFLRRYYIDQDCLRLEENRQSWLLLIKTLPKLEQILTAERLPRAMVRNILQVPERCGQHEVLEWGKTIAGKDTQLLKPLQRLEQVYQQLAHTHVQQHVLLDLG